ncbi:hypothetical protein TYRP_013973 [Tyrophagus putrescentiae]|nr:hypothetical protein TYRP_013973 [Tyrophagus putrescentiae]
MDSAPKTAKCLKKVDPKISKYHRNGEKDRIADSGNLDRLKAFFGAPLLAEYRTSYNHTYFIFGLTVGLNAVQRRRAAVNCVVHLTEQRQSGHADHRLQGEHVQRDGSLGKVEPSVEDEQHAVQRGADGHAKAIVKSCNQLEDDIKMRGEPYGILEQPLRYDPFDYSAAAEYGGEATELNR